MKPTKKITIKSTAGNDMEVDVYRLPETGGVLAVQAVPLHDDSVAWVALHVSSSHWLSPFGFADQGRAIQALLSFWNAIGKHRQLQLTVPISHAELANASPDILAAFAEHYVRPANLAVLQLEPSRET